MGDLIASCRVQNPMCILIVLVCCCLWFSGLNCLFSEVFLRVLWIMVLYIFLFSVCFENTRWFVGFSLVCCVMALNSFRTLVFGYLAFGALFWFFVLVVSPCIAKLRFFVAFCQVFRLPIDRTCVCYKQGLVVITRFLSVCCESFYCISYMD